MCPTGTTDGGPIVVKGGTCTPTDLQFCFKPCGPDNSGLKSETCTTAGVYAEMSGCTFDPARDYSCYKLPPVASSACQMTPQNNAACTFDPCVLCNSQGGLPNGTYMDSAGAVKMGYCVCASTGKWSCASDTAWPCPGNVGC
jgi:hypothetical protein